MKLLALVALIAVIVGTSVAVAATERLDLSLVVWSAVAWSFVPLAQLATGLVMIRGSVAGTPRRALVGSLCDYFETHWPWSLWTIAMSLAFVTIPRSRDLVMWLLVSAVVPVWLTVGLLFRLCRERLHMPPALARRRVVQHQAITMAMLFGTAAYVIALWPRVVWVFE